MKASIASQRLHGLRRIVQARRGSWKVPGIAVGVVVDGQRVFAEGFGTRRLGHDQPVTADTVFAICSCTKAFTTMLLGMLAEEGRLDWDRPVQEVLPEFDMFDRVVGQRLTPRDLVTHRSGLPRHDYAWYGSSASRTELVQALRYLEPTADLRTTYQYQNLMYMTAGYLAGKVAGSSWEVLVRERILEPLGMAATSLSIGDLQSSVHGARPHESRGAKMREVPYRSLDALAPAGAINSTVNDMTRWLRLHLAGGTFDGRRILSADILRDAYRPHMSIGDGGEEPEFQLCSYGLGWTVMAYRGHRVVTHAGGIDGFRCRVALLPDEGAATVVLSNADTDLPHALTWELLDSLLALTPGNWNRRARLVARNQAAEAKKLRRQELAGRVRGTKPSHKLCDYAGTYQHPGYGQIHVRLEKRRLVASLNDLDGYLRHFHHDTFEFHGRRWTTPMLVSFVTDVSGRAAQLSAPLQDGAANILFQRQDATG